MSSGWPPVPLHLCGFTPDQRAVVKAKAAKHAADEMETAIRAVFPTFKIPKLRRAEAGALVADQAENNDDDWTREFDGPLSSPHHGDDEFSDIGALLARGEEGT